MTILWPISQVRRETSCANLSSTDSMRRIMCLGRIPISWVWIQRCWGGCLENKVNKPWNLVELNVCMAVWPAIVYRHGIPGILAFEWNLVRRDSAVRMVPVPNCRSLFLDLQFMSQVLEVLRFTDLGLNLRRISSSCHVWLVAREIALVLLAEEVATENWRASTSAEPWIFLDRSKVQIFFGMLILDVFAFRIDTRGCNLRPISQSCRGTEGLFSFSGWDCFGKLGIMACKWATYMYTH